MPLGNGRLIKTEDEIGVVEAWHWPPAEVVAERAAEARRSIVADVPAEHLTGIKARFAGSAYKADAKGRTVGW